MRALVQRVAEAAVTVECKEVGRIGPGLCALVGVTHADTPEIAARLADKVAHLRIFADEAGAMNRSVGEVDGEVLVVSQFTLYADTTRGRRPSFVDAAAPEHAEARVAEVVQRLAAQGLRVATGRFRAHMRVALVNDGPVTVLVEV